MQATPLNQFDATILRITLTEAAPRRPRGTMRARDAGSTTVLIGWWTEPRWVLGIDEHGFIIAERGNSLGHLLAGYEGSTHPDMPAFRESPVGLARRSQGDHSAWWSHVAHPTVRYGGATFPGAPYGPGVVHMSTHPDMRVTPITRADIQRLRRDAHWDHEAPPLVLMSSLKALSPPLERPLRGL